MYLIETVSGCHYIMHLITTHLQNKFISIDIYLASFSCLGWNQLTSMEDIVLLVSWTLGSKNYNKQDTYIHDKDESIPEIWYFGHNKYPSRSDNPKILRQHNVLSGKTRLIEISKPECSNHRPFVSQSLCFNEPPCLLPYQPDLIWH